MKLRRWLAGVLVVFALAGCAPAETGQGQAPYPPYSRGDEGGMNRGPDM